MRSRFLRLVQTSCNMSLRDGLSLVETHLDATQSSPSSQKTKLPPEHSSSSQSVRKTQFPGKSLSHMQVSVILLQLCTSFSLPLLLFVPLSPLLSCFSLSFSSSLPSPPSSTSLLCVSGKACLINDTRHRVSSEGWVSDK